MKGIDLPWNKESSGHRGKLCREEGQLAFGRRDIEECEVENARKKKGESLHVRQ